MLHPISLIIPLMIIAPNLAFICFPPRNQPQGQSQAANTVLKGAEGVGQLGCCLLPLFAPVQIEGAGEAVALAGMVLFLALYYWGWSRYYLGRREYKLLFAPLWRIPVPMALFPVLYFAASSAMLHSPYMLISSLILGAGHIPISFKSCKMARE